MEYRQFEGTFIVREAGPVAVGALATSMVGMGVFLAFGYHASRARSARPLRSPRLCRRQHTPAAGTIRIQRGRMLISFVYVPATSIRLPDFDQRIRDGTPIVIEHAPRHADPLPMARRHVGA